MSYVALLIVFILVLAVLSISSKTQSQKTSFEIEDHRPKATLFYDENSRDLAEYFLETLGNSDSVSTKLVFGSSPVMIIQTKKDQTVITSAIRTAIDDLV